jgi:hypothetical protein
MSLFTRNHYKAGEEPQIEGLEYAKEKGWAVSFQNVGWSNPNDEYQFNKGDEVIWHTNQLGWARATITATNYIKHRYDKSLIKIIDRN